MTDARATRDGAGATSPPRGSCAIAPVRGDVTTVRAAAMLRDRRDPSGRPAEAPSAALSAAPCDAHRPPAFPSHLMEAGPA